MPNMRKDVWKLGTGWSDTLVWYAKAVAVMRARPIADPTSWSYLAAMHGFDPDLWRTFGYTNGSTVLPSAAAQARDWKQCQHQSWYFLPWHRGYLGAFEAIVRAAIVSLNGPADWALPYWNYTDATNPNAGNLPPAFSAATLPDGTPNALLVTRRYGEDGQGTIAMTSQDINIDALTEDQFDDGGSDGSPGFGGPQTTFSHDGDTNGMLENQPHNVVHGLVGGMVRGGNQNRASDQGLMSMPDTAALDPIFWVHHANIDRLWEVWRGMSGHELPGDATWLSGPADRTFSMPKPDGTAASYTANDMLNTQAATLNYVYEDISAPSGGADRTAARLTGLNVSAADIASITRVGRRPMAKRPAAERMGANDAAVQIDGGAVSTTVRLDHTVTRTMSNSFRSAAVTGATAKEPDRVYLNLENIRGASDAAVFRVYVNLPDGADPAAHPELQAGTVSLFGVGKASRTDGAHAGNGINQVLEITRIVDALHLKSGLDLDHLNVRFVPRTEIRPEDKISVGRVSVYRQGQ